MTSSWRGDSALQGNKLSKTLSMISVNVHSSFKCEAEKSTGAIANHLHTLTTAITMPYLLDWQLLTTFRSSTFRTCEFHSDKSRGNLYMITLK